MADVQLKMSLKVPLMEETPMSLRLVSENPKQISVIMAVETCSKAFLALCRRHGKSPCCLQGAFLCLVRVDCSVIFACC